MTISRFVFFGPLALGALVACSSSSSGGGGTGDASLHDASPADAETSEAARTEAGTSEAGGEAASSSEAGGADAGASEAGSSDAGSSDAGSDAPSTCKNDLSDIGAGDFRISLTLRTTQQDASFALLDQRSACGPGNFWDVRIHSGVIEVETDALTDAAPDDTEVDGCTTVNDGQMHQVVVQRVSGVLSVYVDGLSDGSVPSTASFGALAALAIGTDPCVGVNGIVAFDTAKGSITNLCIASVSEAQPDAGSSTCF